MRLLPVLLVPLLLSLAGCSDGGSDGDDPGPDPGTGGGGTTGGGDGNGGDNGTMTPPEEVSVSISLEGAYPVNIAYQPATLSVPAGATVTLTFTNDDTNPLVSHDWALEGFEATAQTATIGNGQSATVTFTAPAVPGEYTFYCSVPGHRDNGMTGTFTVT